MREPRPPGRIPSNPEPSAGQAGVVEDSSEDPALLPAIAKRRGSHESLTELVGTTHDLFLTIHELERHRSSLGILLLLHMEHSASKSRMRRRLKSGQEALESSLDCLVRLRLVNRVSAQDFPFTQTYRLTGSGKFMVETPLVSWPAIFTG